MKLSTTVATIASVQCLSSSCVTTASCGERFVPTELSVGQLICATTSIGSTKCWDFEFRDRMFQKTDFPNAIGTSYGDIYLEMGDNLPRFYLGGEDRKVKKVVQSMYHESLCAIFEDGGAVCVGNSEYGKTGQVGNQNPYLLTRPSATNPTSLPDINFGQGRKVIDLAMGERHTCAILDNHELKCWGDNSKGQLGQLSNNALSKIEYSANIGESTDLGSADRKAVQVSAGNSHTCVRFDDGKVKCFGDSAAHGVRLKNLKFENIGDDPDEMGDNLPILDLGEDYFAIDIQSSSNHNCVLFQDGSMKCWGENGDGAMGGGSAIAFDEVPKDFGMDRTVTQMSLGESHTCVLLSDKQVKCFGHDLFGQLGHGSDHKHAGLISYSKFKDTLPAVDLADNVIGVFAGTLNTCAIVENGSVYCWGVNIALGIDSSTVVERFPRGPVDLGCDCTLAIHESFGVCNPITCNTVNGNCEFGTCFGASGDGTCTSCKDGFVGLNCELPKTCNLNGGSCSTNCDEGCESCDATHFGLYCENDITCAAPGVCDDSACSGLNGNGMCSDLTNCNAFAGPNCDIPITCSEVNGICGVGCNGPMGNGHCSSCQEGFYGLDCNLVVQCDEDHGVCAEGEESCYGIHGKGHCTSCNQGRFGKTCDEVTCNLENGECGFACEDPIGNGFCTSCNDGYYGGNCNFNVTCPLNTGLCNSRICSGVEGDGECSSCKDRYYGPKCQQLSSCDVENGSCGTGCTGTQGNGKCSACEPGYFGQHCTEVSSCDKSNGNCGSNCSPDGNGLCASCASSYYGQNCTEKVSCDILTGYCHKDSCSGIEGDGFCTYCMTGWEGMNCESAKLNATRDSPLNTIAIVLGAIGVVFGVLGIIGSWNKNSDNQSTVSSDEHLVQEETQDKSVGYFAETDEEHDRTFSL